MPYLSYDTILYYQFGGNYSTNGAYSINSIEKARLSAESFSFSGSNDAWKARLVLFLGFALMAGGLAGSVVRILYIQYILCGTVQGGG